MNSPLAKVKVKNPKARGTRDPARIGGWACKNKSLSRKQK